MVLAILWWVWVAWAWLGNVMRADRGMPLAGFIVSMVATFGIALTVVGVWDAEGGSLVALTFAGLYVLIRMVHAAVHLWGVRDDERLRRHVQLSAAAWVPGAGLLVVGAFAEPDERLFWWIGTLTFDIATTWVIAVRGPGWRVHSGQHFSDRFDLVVMLAIGESLLALGITAIDLDVTPSLLGLGLLGALVSFSLWWPYFKDVGPTLEEALEDAEPERKADIARDAYTYLHLPLVMGIILVSAGVKEAVIELEQEPAGGAAILLAAGAALFSVTAAALMGVAGGTWGWLVTSGAFFIVGIAWLPLLNPTVAIALTVVVLAFVGWVTPSARHRPTVAVESTT